MTKVIANLSVKTSDSYQENALRTKSDSFFGANINRNHLIFSLAHIIADNENLDILKKSMFYGKGLGEHTPVIDPDVSVKTEDRQLIDVIHGIIGINTEGGELAERLNAVLSKREGLPLYEKNMTSLLSEEDKVNIFEELGDVLWYIAITAEALGVSIDALMIANIDKLKARYPDKFTKEEANDRNIENEQKTLEKNLTEWQETPKVESPKQATKRTPK